MNVSRVAIDASELRDKEVKDLAKFLEGKVKAKVDIAGGEITINYEEERGKVLPKTYLRVLLRKFLHKAGLREQFRVISGRESVFIVKERKQTIMEE